MASSRVAERTVRGIVKAEILRDEKYSARADKLKDIFSSAARWWSKHHFNENIALDKFLLAVRDENAGAPDEIEGIFLRFVKNYIFEYGEIQTMCDLTTYTSYIVVKSIADGLGGENQTVNAFAAYIANCRDNTCLSRDEYAYKGF